MISAATSGKTIMGYISDANGYVTPTEIMLITEDSVDAFMGLVYCDDTKIYKINDKSIDYAKNLILNNQLVAFPTETVYGLAANALDEDAVKKIFVAKGRPSDNPLIVHIADKEDLTIVARNVSDKAELIIQQFWPGPLTLIFEKQYIVVKFFY